MSTEQQTTAPNENPTTEPTQKKKKRKLSAEEIRALRVKYQKH